MSTIFDDTDGIHPTRGQQVTFSEDFAGLGGDIRYLRTQAFATKYKSFGGWILSLHGEGGYIKALQSAPGPGRDPIRITDRFFNSSIRGFDIRGIGPRVVRIPYDTTGALTELDINKDVNDAIGGRAFYLARAELEIPVSASVKSMGLRPSVYVDAGSLWSVTKPPLLDVVAFCSPVAGTTGLSPFNSSNRTAASIRIRTSRLRIQRSSRQPGLQGSVPRQFAEAAGFDRHRRQLDFAVRAAPARPRESARSSRRATTPNSSPST